MKKLRIYDIDGTITHPGNDLWYLTTRALTSDLPLFEEQWLKRKNDITSGTCPYQASYTMQLKGIQLMDLSASGEKVKNTAKQFTHSIIKQGKYYHKAITHINKSLNEGYEIAFSTTNYREGAAGFLEVLNECSLMDKTSESQINISGTEINWSNKSVIHFNMAEDKVKGLCTTLGINQQTLFHRVDSCYGDDPEGNDRGILNITSNAFVIENEKNKDCLLPLHMKLTNWDCLVNEIID